MKWWGPNGHEALSLFHSAFHFILEFERNVVCQVLNLQLAAVAKHLDRKPIF